MILSNKIYDSIDEILIPDSAIEWINKKGIRYGNIACTFDIETSSFINEVGDKQAIMYAWILGINGKCIIGRTWEEFINCINKIIDYYELSSRKILIFYVHNLSFEFQFIKHYFEWEKVFAMEERKPIYAKSIDGIMFKCSYLLSGLSLAKVGENLIRYKVNKMIGDLDYDLIRHSKTPLTEKELGYILNDGLVVMAFIQEEIENNGDITLIPHTKTGYVRNYCRNICLKKSVRFEYNKLMRFMTLTEEDYKHSKLSFSGGFTHANAYYVNKIVNNVGSFDETSAYPFTMVSEKFPISKPFKHKIISGLDFKDKLKKYCCMFTCTFHNINSKVKYENYISKHKCIEIEHFALNNGRVVSATLLTINITEIDFEIIKTLYEWDYIDISNFRYMYKGYLPKQIIEAVLKLYNDKTTLKGVEGKEVEYMNSKAMLNSMYGMCVTDICRDEIGYNSSGWVRDSVDIQEALKKYNSGNNRFLYFMWGIWITAYARKNLFMLINEFKDDYIYSDTDSVKGINIDNHINFIENYNINTQEKIKKCLSYYDISYSQATPKNIKGEIKLLGIWEYEGMYNKFKTLGAKRYIYYMNDKLNITISGVNKKNGVDYLYWKYKNVDNIFKNFNEGLIFPSNYDDGKNGSGKLTHTYLDEYQTGFITDYLGNTEKYVEYSSVHLEPCSYELSLDDMFLKYLLYIGSSEIIRK